MPFETHEGRLRKLLGTVTTIGYSDRHQYRKKLEEIFKTSRDVAKKKIEQPQLEAQFDSWLPSLLIKFDLLLKVAQAFEAKAQSSSNKSIHAYTEVNFAKLRSKLSAINPDTNTFKRLENSEQVSFQPALQKLIEFAVYLAEEMSLSPAISQRLNDAVRDLRVGVKSTNSWYELPYLVTWRDYPEGLSYLIGVLSVLTRAEFRAVIKYGMKNSLDVDWLLLESIIFGKASQKVAVQLQLLGLGGTTLSLEEVNEHIIDETKLARIRSRLDEDGELKDVSEHTQLADGENQHIS